MPLHVSKFEKLENADRNAFGLAALEVCRAARETAGVNDSRYFWANPNELVIITDAEPGAWGPGSANQMSARSAKAFYALSDLGRSSLNETWVDARAGLESFQLSRS